MQPETNNNLQSLNPKFSNKLIVLDFVNWFYGYTPKKIVEIWKNYLIATFHYFSIGLLLRTLFAYWHKDTEDYGRGFDFGRYIRVFSLNVVSRGVGFVIRSVIIVVGLASEIFVFIWGLFALAFWFAAPLILVLLFLYGFRLLF